MLATADVVVYDRLSVASLLDLARRRPSASTSASHRGGHGPRSEIDALLVQRGAPAPEVVRLKGGDPFVFARGGEEAGALFGPGVPFEVVPGHRSAIAVTGVRRHPADDAALVDLVHRDHRPRGPRQGRRDRLGGGGPARRHDRHPHGGRAAAQDRGPAAGRRARSTRRPPRSAGVRAPSSTPCRPRWPPWSTSRSSRQPRSWIGAVAAIDLAWFESRPLFGTRIVVTRAREQASGLVRSLQQLGAQVIEAPAIVAIRPTAAPCWRDGMPWRTPTTGSWSRRPTVPVGCWLRCTTGATSGGAGRGHRPGYSRHAPEREHRRGPRARAVRGREPARGVPCGPDERRPRAAGPGHGRARRAARGAASRGVAGRRGRGPRGRTEAAPIAEDTRAASSPQVMLHVPSSTVDRFVDAFGGGAVGRGLDRACHLGHRPRARPHGRHRSRRPQHPRPRQRAGEIDGLARPLCRGCAERSRLARFSFRRSPPRPRGVSLPRGTRSFTPLGRSSSSRRGEGRGGGGRPPAVGGVGGRGGAGRRRLVGRGGTTGGRSSHHGGAGGGAPRGGRAARPGGGRRTCRRRIELVDHLGRAAPA